MNAGKIDSDTAAGRLHRFLRAAPNVFFAANDLAGRIQTTCISTRVSEVRKQVPAGERIVSKRVQIDGQPKWYYGLEISA